MRRPIVIAGLALLAAAAVLGGLIALGQSMRSWLKDDPRYQFPFSDIECSAPQGLSRESFLAEVRYLAELPEQLSLLDDELAMRLSAGFLSHPWVEKVDRVEVGPGRSIRVQLTFRTPVLAVTYSDRNLHTCGMDRFGVLLPLAADVRKLPRLAGTAPPPKNGPGLPWGDSRVEGSAKVAGLLQPHQEKLKLYWFEWRSGELHLAREEGSGPTVIWGRAPRADNDEEAIQKLQKLLDYCERNGDLGKPEAKTVHDVRSEGK